MFNLRLHRLANAESPELCAGAVLKLNGHDLERVKHEAKQRLDRRTLHMVGGHLIDNLHIRHLEHIANPNTSHMSLAADVIDDDLHGGSLWHSLKHLVKKINHGVRKGLDVVNPILQNDLGIIGQGASKIVGTGSESVRRLVG